MNPRKFRKAVIFPWFMCQGRPLLCTQTFWFG